MYEYAVYSYLDHFWIGVQRSLAVCVKATFSKLRLEIFFSSNFQILNKFHVDSLEKSLSSSKLKLFNTIKIKKKKKLFQTKQNLKSFLRVLYVCESLLMTI